ncbi:stage III sporulation protein AF [Salicibibacter kimchii]|uniref:Stage III sporulation protein AF n=1 Tax=Salicibibacter kimchii TaxID=2099786 RepID=A0A345BV06_9BACI|nr:stage III sporulation protein AF [Salicibibacter kimchii]
MAYFNEWITTLIVFLLIAVILELLLPTSTMKRYADLILGLIMMILILQPVFDLLNREPETWFDWGDFQVTEGVDEMEIAIDEKKSEIQASHDAYISEQVGARLGREAEQALEDDFNLGIKEISAATDTELEVAVVVGEVDEQEAETVAVQPVDEISTDDATETADHTRTGEDRETEEVRARLAEVWQIEESNIDVSLEEEGLNE